MPIWQSIDLLPFWPALFLDFNFFLIVTSFTFIWKCLNKLKLDIRICSSQDIAIALCLVMPLALISFFCFFLHLACDYSYFIQSIILLYYGWSDERTDWRKSSPETSHYIENTWFSQKLKLSCTYLHLIDILNDLKAFQ